MGIWCVVVLSCAFPVFAMAQDDVATLSLELGGYAGSQVHDLSRGDEADRSKPVGSTSAWVSCPWLDSCSTAFS